MNVDLRDAQQVAAYLRDVISSRGNDDANAILGQLDETALAVVVADLERYADEVADPFARFRVLMILFGIFHRDRVEDGGTIYIRTAAMPDPERAAVYYEQAQQVYIAAISDLLDKELRSRGLHAEPDVTAYRLRIPEAYRERTLRARSGVRIELDSCVGNDHVLVSQEIGARIIHVSILLRNAETGAYDYPIEADVRRIDEPVLRLHSVDKQAGPIEVRTTEALFDLRAEGANEWIRLSKAAVIAAGIVPYACGAAPDQFELSAYLTQLGGGIEITTNVTGIPVGSGLGTSSAIAATILCALVKFSGQTESGLTDISDEEKRLVVARVLLVEQMIGALGGWQDPCTIFPGIKLLETQPGDFLPAWKPIAVAKEARDELVRRLRLTDGAYRQPSQAAAWQFTGLWVMRLKSVYDARMRSREIVEDQIHHLESGNIAAMGPLESEDWINRTRISPKATNPYVEQVLALVREGLPDQQIDFDACGARGGAGGCWWIDPDTLLPEVFELAFTGASLQAIDELKDRIRFEGTPHVYDYALNDTGIVFDLVP